MEGVRRQPSDFEPCCARFDLAIETCQHEGRFEWYGDGWVLNVADSESGIDLLFCPFYGTSLPHAEKERSYTWRRLDPNVLKLFEEEER